MDILVVDESKIILILCKNLGRNYGNIQQISFDPNRFLETKGKNPSDQEENILPLNR